MFCCIFKVRPPKVEERQEESTQVRHGLSDEMWEKDVAQAQQKLGMQVYATGKDKSFHRLYSYTKLKQCVFGELQADNCCVARLPLWKPRTSLEALFDDVSSHWTE